MPELAKELFRLEMSCDARAPAVVRDALRREPVLTARIGDVLLIASELVSNAVLHSGCLESQPIEVEVSVTSERVCISVRDLGCSGQRARLRRDQAVGGWGLQIVDKLAERWGSERDHAHHHVWAEVALASER